jgi:hypothetical protein
LIDNAITGQRISVGGGRRYGAAWRIVVGALIERAEDHAGIIAFGRGG